STASSAYSPLSCGPWQQRDGNHARRGSVPLGEHHDPARSSGIGARSTRLHGPGSPIPAPVWPLGGPEPDLLAPRSPLCGPSRHPHGRKIGSPARIRRGEAGIHRPAGGILRQGGTHRFRAGDRIVRDGDRSRGRRGPISREEGTHCAEGGTHCAEGGTHLAPERDRRRGGQWGVSLAFPGLDSGMLAGVRLRALTSLALMLAGCEPELGECDPEAAIAVAYDPVDGMPAYEGQALMIASCGNGGFCHGADVTSAESLFGVPAGL